MCLKHLNSLKDLGLSADATVEKGSYVTYALLKKIVLNTEKLQKCCKYTHSCTGFSEQRHVIPARIGAHVSARTNRSRGQVIQIPKTSLEKYSKQ